MRRWPFVLKSPPFTASRCRRSVGFGGVARTSFLRLGRGLLLALICGLSLWRWGVRQARSDSLRAGNRRARAGADQRGDHLGGGVSFEPTDRCTKRGRTSARSGKLGADELSRPRVAALALGASELGMGRAGRGGGPTAFDGDTEVRGMGRGSHRGAPRPGHDGEAPDFGARRVRGSAGSPGNGRSLHPF